MVGIQYSPVFLWRTNIYVADNHIIYYGYNLLYSLKWGQILTWRTNFTPCIPLPGQQYILSYFILMNSVLMVLHNFRGLQYNEIGCLRTVHPFVL